MNVARRLDDLELVIAKNVDSALIVGRCVIKGDLVGRRSGLFAAPLL